MEERLDRAEGRLDQHGEWIAGLRAATLTNTQNLDRLVGVGERFVNVAVDAITELRTTTARLDRTVEELRAMGLRQQEAIEELRASNRRQEAINDYILRRDRERGNG
ncbi:hypothetical protein [Gloeobacter morelensis]|uniref:UBA domain-containing protein n=1 Tax=Gloeobacter morelensis MG652769 TaxID=2781736 RepID=A0ABY3PMB6_9CYAN|nr:hypothetical protein [Gloeobacter morelensis]UFP94831.1 hypothetical protein ISF26_00850 [Gloeobacter morelensis MG652769]